MSSATRKIGAVSGNGAVGYAATGDWRQFGRFRQFLSGSSDLAFIDAEAMMKRQKSTSRSIFIARPICMSPKRRSCGRPGNRRPLAQRGDRPDVRWNEKLTLSHARELRQLGAFHVAAGPIGRCCALLCGGLFYRRTEADGHWFVPDERRLTDAPTTASGGRSIGNLFAAGTVLAAPSGHGPVRKFLQRPLLGARPAPLLLLHPPRPRSDQPIQLFYDTIPADTKYFIFEYYGPWLTAGIAKQMLAGNDRRRSLLWSSARSYSSMALCHFSSRCIILSPIGVRTR